MYKIYKGWLDSAKSLSRCKAQKNVYTRRQVFMQTHTYRRTATVPKSAQLQCFICFLNNAHQQKSFHFEQFYIGTHDGLLHKTLSFL